MALDATTTAVSWLPGHGWRDGHWDPGATSPAGWSEAELVRDVAAVAWRACEHARVPTEIVSAGTYRQRGVDAEAGLGSRLIVQLHADAVEADVGPDITRVFYYPRSKVGEAVAKKLAGELAGVVPWPVQVIEATEKWKNARACLISVGKTPSVLVELGFTDGAEGRVKLPVLVGALGEALAAGVIST